MMTTISNGNEFSSWIATAEESAESIRTAGSNAEDCSDTVGNFCCLID